MLCPNTPVLSFCSRSQAPARSPVLAGRCWRAGVGGPVLAGTTTLSRGRPRFQGDCPEYRWPQSACVPLLFCYHHSHEAPFFGCFNTLAVDHGDRRQGVSILCHTHLFLQRRQHDVPNTALLPAPETRVNGFPVWVSLGQVAPLAAGALNIEDRVQDRAPRNLSWLTRRGTKHGRHGLPLRVTHVTWIKGFISTFHQIQFDSIQTVKTGS